MTIDSGRKSFSFATGGEVVHILAAHSPCRARLQVFESAQSTAEECTLGGGSLLVAAALVCLQLHHRD